ncbi:beta-sandwich domain of Sec23/24 [Metschnikowia bicuspidata]|uniref:Beta-sandwich domain of Sec23/24 n=1 Tax=Metschnikowia bicuspidata TaxID=27322 RepID=A0A4P9ZI85_9ASCO|nr:beta-sandwich domain of Sec23/24 [Metschnikowia bicuspidata]
MNASPAELAAPFANLNVSRPKKKKPARAYHSHQYNQFQEPSQPAQPNQFSQVNHSSQNAPAEGFDYPQAAGSSVNISNPVQMATQEDVLSLAAARHAQQQRYSTPLYSESGEPLGFKSFLSFENVRPPMAGTQYHATDQCSAVPKFIRTTMYSVPESENLRRATKLPLAVTVRPFAPLLASELPVPVVDMSKLGEFDARDNLDIGPPRCNRCRAFINPFMLFSGPMRFICNICQFPSNTLPLEYSAPVDVTTQQRSDRLMRPELHRGVYDIILPSYYNVDGKAVVHKGFHHVFVVDISHQSVIKQLPVLVADALRAAIFDYQNSDAALQLAVQRNFKFAIILFDKKVQFFNLSAKLESAQLAVSPDLEDPFVPFIDGLFVDPDECATQLEDALNKLEEICSANTMHDSEPCLSVALRAATMCLEQVGGGKITAILSTLSSWGPGRSEIKSLRAVGRNPLAEMEKELLSPTSKYYQLLVKDMIVHNVGLDVFAVADTPIDIANLGWLASSTGGKVHKFVNFLPMRDGRSFISKVYESVHKTVGYQGLFKLRCSTGLQVLRYYGFPANNDSGIAGYSHPGLPDPVVPVLTEDQTFTVLLEFDGVLRTSYDCHFQASVLYTDAQGVRKLRVMNLVTSVSERLPDVFNFVDQEAIAVTILREALTFAGKQSIADLRKSVNEKIVDIFSHYRAMAEQSGEFNPSMARELVFPDSMKHFALYSLAIIKTRALRDSAAISDDLRLCDLYQMMFMPVDQLVYHLCPALVEVHSFMEDDCMVIEDEANVDYFIKLPESIPLTAKATVNSLYILCNGTSVFVRIHPETNPLLLKDLFGEHVDSCKDVDRDLDCFPDLPTHISQQARNLVKYFHMNIIRSSLIDESSIIIARDSFDSTFHPYSECLVEDKLPSKTINTSPNYVEFLASVHKAVNVKLASDKSTKKDLQTTYTHDTLAQRMIHY